jgi:exodeoxyribonuclease VII large subunit
MQPFDISDTHEIFTVTRLNREARLILEDNFRQVWIEGEISNFVVPQSGHWYFTLKDTNAQVRCAMFRTSNRKLDFTPKDGMHVMLKASVSLYEGRGEFQLLAEHMEEVGIGKLRQAFEALKKRLQEAGLFNPADKKTLPQMPTSLGIITSPTGAAIKDILSVLNRRYPALPIIIYPTLVQGEAAAANIVKAIQTANRRSECDVLILARGGGSLEDLWPFNEEIVAHAIYQSQIPIISGVGHEIDFTIADFVADVRAPTPSAAAELVAPHIEELLESLDLLQQRITRQMHQKIRDTTQNITWLNKHLQQQHPKRKLAEKTQHLDQCEINLARLMTKFLTHHQTKLNAQRLELFSATPLHQIREIKNKLALNTQHLKNTIQTQLQAQQQTLSNASGKLNALSPLATLSRGFSITTKNNKVIRNASNVKRGDQVQIQLMEGKLDCTVDKTTQ